MHAHRKKLHAVQSADLNNLPRVSLWMANLADSIIRPFCTPTKEKKIVFYIESSRCIRRCR